jgi:hypothetical protein
MVPQMPWWVRPGVVGLSSPRNLMGIHPQARTAAVTEHQGGETWKWSPIFSPRTHQTGGLDQTDTQSRIAVRYGVPTAVHVAVPAAGQHKQI